MQYSIVNYSQIDTELFRLEAEFYRLEYLALEKEFENNPCLIDFCHRIICGPFGSVVLDETYTSSGVKLIRPFNINNYQIEESNIVYISYNHIEEKKLNTFTKGAILFSRVGDIKCGVFTEDEMVTISPNIIAIDIIEEGYNPYFLTLFFNSKYGFLQIQRELKISAQPTISTERLKKLKLPITDIYFQNHIGYIFETAEELNSYSKSFYQQAPNLLLTELGLNDWQPKHRLTFIKNYSDTKQANRIDAEYYQPKYEDIINAIKNYSGGYQSLDCYIENYSTGFPFKSDSYIENGTYLIRINNIKNDQLDISNAVKISNIDKKLSPKDIANENDILISMSGTIGSACKIPRGIDAVINQRIFKLTPKNYNVDVLILILNSNIGLQQLLRVGTGGVQTNISGNDIKKILIPILPAAKQTQIQQKVTESFKLRKQSKHLLECAKQAVEIAIEKNEEVAMKWLKNETIKTEI